MADGNPFSQERQRRHVGNQSPVANQGNPFSNELTRRQSDVDPARVQLGAEIAQRSFSADPFAPRENAMELGFRRFLNNVLAIPSGAGEALALGGAAAQTAAGTLTGQEGGIGERFSQNLQEHQQQFPAAPLRAIPRPTTGDIIAGGQAATGAVGNLLQGERPNIGGEFAERQMEQQGRLQSLEQGPGGTTGQITGDVLTLMSGRAPFSRARAPARREAREAAEQSFQRAPAELPEHVRGQFRDVLTDKVAGLLGKRSGELRRAAQRSAEAGLETGALAILSDDDPVASAALGSAAQGAGSLGLFLAEKPIKRLVPVVGGAFLIKQMFDAVGPGERNVFESFDFAVDKTIGAIALGAAGTLAGAGRLRGPAAENFPAIMDAITSVPRGVVQNRLREMTEQSESGNEVPLRTLDILSSDPERFNNNQIKSLQRALLSEKSGSFVKEVNRLNSESRSFREALSSNGDQ